MSNSDNENSQGKQHQRRLAAIMFTDMVGYSALSQKNEALALELLETHRNILRPVFVEYSGKEIDTAGDSFFVEFQSAVDAANCAVEIQTRLYERNKTVDSEKVILIRIGLHIGDVVQLGSNVHGDGVNIAARLEPVATPGGICLSGDFARAVQNKLKYSVVRKGETKLKNITEPMEIYCIRLPWVEEKRLGSDKAGREKILRKSILKYALPPVLLIILVIVILGVLNLLSPGKDGKQIHNRLAVLPFTNIGGNPDDDYFAEGMTEQIISSLSNLSGLNVIARSSVMKYKDAGINIRQIGDELNVETVLEGSVRKAMDKARITVKLIDVSTEENIWAMDYDKELKDIFMVQSEIAQNVALNLEVKLRNEERVRLERKTPVNTDAYNAYLLGRFYLNRRNIEGVKRGITYFEKAIQYDSTFALAYSGLADAYTLIGAAGYGIIPIEEAIAKANQNVMTALEYDENLAEAHASLAYIKFRLEWKFDEAEDEFKKAINLGPSYAQAHEWYALFLALRGRFPEALERMKLAYELNPLSTSVSNGMGRIYYFMGDFQKALDQFGNTIKMDPNYAEAYFSLGMTHTAMAEYKKAMQEIEKAVNLSNRRLIILSDLAYVYVMTGEKVKAAEIIKEFDERSKTENISPFLYVPYYIGLKDYKRVFELFEKAYEEKFGLMLYIKADHMFGGEIRKDPRYIDLIKRIGL